MIFDPPHKTAILGRGMWIVAAMAIAILVCATAGSVGGGAGLLTPMVVWIPQEHHTGGAYTAIQAAPDGTVYLGTTMYDGFARLLMLAPGTREFRLIADMAEATGESIPGPFAQAKIHTKPAVAQDGKVYFGTKSGKPADEERWQANYPGGHLLVYDPQSRRVTDLGIPRPRQSIIAVGIDQRRGLVYALTDPEGHLLTYDPRTRVFADRGQLIPAHPPTRYLVVLANGDVYHPAGTAAFIRYQASYQRMERLPLQFSGNGSYEVSRGGHGPYAVAASIDGTRFYGVGEASGELYTFTPGDRTLAVQFHGRALPAGTAGRISHYAMAAAPDGNLYYTATLQAGSGDGTLYILKLATGTGRAEVVGQAAPLPPPPFPLTRRPGRLMVQGATVGPDGTLYVMLAYPLRVLVFPRLAAP
jgi:outer membrane protein assembly factor BamB